MKLSRIWHVLGLFLVLGGTGCATPEPEVVEGDESESLGTNSQALILAPATSSAALGSAALAPTPPARLDVASNAATLRPAALTSVAPVLALEGDTDAPNAVAIRSTSFTFDTSALVQPAAAALPRAPLTLARVREDNIARTLLLAADAPEPVTEQGSVRFFKTQDWEFEKDELTGRVVGLSTKPIGPKRVLRPDALQTDAISRLASYGIGREEVGRVLQRQVMAQDFDGGATSAPEIHSYKTFIFRAFNGIPVAGHRAVLSHAPDGSLRKVLMTWPALAKSGHSLRTRLSASQVEARASTALAREGKSAGRANLAWRYVPERTASGEVTLRLTAVARLGGSAEPDGTTEEARYVEVDVSAEP
jgi:hypothetical protein